MKLQSLHCLALLASLPAAAAGCEIHLGYDDGAPEAPTLISADPVGRTRANLTLETPADFAGGARSFSIEVLDGPEGSVIASATRASSGGLQSIVVDGLRPGVPAYLSVATVDGNDNRSTRTVIGPVITEFDFTGAIFPPSHQDGDNAFGYRIVHGDFDGDARDDVAVAAPFKNVGNLAGAGAIYVFFGGPAGIEMTPGAIIEGTEAFAQLGNALAVLDWNGDGIDDLAAGAPFAANGDGAVYLYSGRAIAGGNPAPMASFVSDGLGWFAQAALGFTLTALDWNGDGARDLAIGAVAGGSDGGVLVVFGTDRGPLGEHGLSDTAPDLGVLSVSRLEAPSESSLFGMTLESGGPRPTSRGSRLVASGFQTGSVVVWNGGEMAVPGVVTDVAWSATRDLEIVSDLPPEAYFGAAVGTIDVGGVFELVIGAYRARNGDGLVAMADLTARGTVSLDAVATAIIVGERGAQLGSAIANNASSRKSGDVDGDGLSDLVIVGGAGEVELLVWYGDQLPSGETTAASAGHHLYAPIGMQGEQPSIGGTPATAAWIGDVDGDGLEDLAWADWTGNGRDGLFEVLR